MYRSLVPRASRAVQYSTTRYMSSSAIRPGAEPKTDQYPDDEHATKKVKGGDVYDVQSSNAKAGMDANDGSAHKNGNGGHATERKDSAGGKSKAKEEFPEAPDVAIGMQDERGGRGA